MNDFIKMIPPLLVSGILLLIAIYERTYFNQSSVLLEILFSVGIFVLVWNSKRLHQSHLFVALGIGYIFMGLFVIFYFMTEQGMFIASQDQSQLSGQFLSSSRLFEGIVLCFASFFTYKKPDVKSFFAIYALIGLVFLGLIFFSDSFPAFYLSAQPLTDTQLFVEIMIIFLVASAMSQIYRRHIYFDRAVYRLLIISFSMIILSQMALLFRTTQSLLIIGQLLNILALYYIYRTVTLFVTLQPSNSVFKDIIKRQNSYVLTQETDKTLTNRLLDQNKKLSEQLEQSKVFEKRLIENEKNYRILASHIPNSAVYLFDKDLKIILAEGSEISATGYEKNDFEGKYMHEFFRHGGKQKLLPKYTKVLMGMSFIEDYTYHDKIYRIRSAPLVDEQDNIYGGVALVQNIEHEKKLENKLETIIAEKEVLLQESYHRIDNNLQIVSSIIDLTLMRIEHQSSREMLADARDKIQSMALVHRQLTTSKDFKTIDISKHLGDLAEYLRTIYASENNISLDVDIDSFRMSIDQVIPLSLIVNELVSNAYKHAFQRQKKGKISLNVSKSVDKVILWVNDTGDNHGLATRASQNRMGLKLVNTLVSRQLKGNMDITNNKGSKIKIEFQYK